MINYELLSVIVSVTLIFLLGFFAKKIGVVKKEDATALNNLIINITLPALIFRGIYKVDLSINLIYIPIIGFVAAGIMVVIANLFGRLLKLDRQLLGSFSLACGVGNTGYIAYPILLALYGDPGLVRGILYDMFSTVFFMLTVGIYICSRYGNSHEKPSVAKELISFPPIYALILGFALRPFDIPFTIMRSLDIVSAVTIGLILLSIGITMEPVKGIKKYYSLISVTAIFKLVLLPMLVFALYRLFDFDALTSKTLIIDASMPTALLTLVFGIRYGLNRQFLSSAIFVLTILSIITVPLMQMLIGLIT